MAENRLGKGRKMGGNLKKMAANNVGKKARKWQQIGFEKVRKLQKNGGKVAANKVGKRQEINRLWRENGRK